MLSEVGSTIKPQPLPPETEHLREERGGGAEVLDNTCILGIV